MNNLTLKNTLKNIGLSDSEIDIYLACLELGASSVISIGVKIGLTRQMVYNILPVLIDQGFVKIVYLDGKKQYQAVNPEILADKTKFIADKVKQIIPVLKSMQAENEALPDIDVYENTLSMRAWYESFMTNAKKEDKLYVYSSEYGEEWLDLDRKFYTKYLDRSEEIGLDVSVILPDTAKARKYQEKANRSGTKIKYIKNSHLTKAEKWIWRDQICYLTIRKNATNMIVIRSKSLADIEKFAFENIWEKNDSKQSVS